MIIELEQFKKGKVYRAQACGPYDGCFSEPVYAFATEDGKADFLCYGEEKNWSHRMLKSVNNAWYYPSEGDTIDEFDFDDITELFEANPEHAVAVTKTVFKRHGYIAECICPECGQMKHTDEFEYDEGSLTGLGGIASMYTAWYCVECISCNQCDCGYLVLNTDDELDEEGKCPDCRSKECKFCKEEKDSMKFDKYGVCEDCQKDDIYEEQLDKYSHLVKQIKYENKHQLRFKDIQPKAIPPFIPIPEEEYINI